MLDVLRAVEDLAELELPQPPVLATAVSLDGSVYDGAGAMAVVASGQTERVGVVDFDELEGRLRDEIEAASRELKPRLVCVPIAEDDPILGYNLGRPGLLELLLEPVGPQLRARLRESREALARGVPLVCSLDLSGSSIGARAIVAGDEAETRTCYRDDTPELIERVAAGAVRRTFVCPIHPMGQVLVVGSGRDAQALSRHALDLGFSVFVADPRRGRLRGRGWDPRRLRLIEGGWEQARAASRVSEDTSIVVMTHSYALDLETLQGALQSPASYIAQIGPRKRTQRILDELALLDVRPRTGVFFGPAGLNIGAETPEEVALSLIGEIFAHRSGRKGGRHAARRAAGPAPKVRIPGLVLAAGRGKRFSGGNKMAAALAGRPVLRHVVENALAAKLDPVIVVLGCEAEEGLKALKGLDDPRLRVVFNPFWENGKASSIEVGLREVPMMCPGVVALLGDMPMVKPWLIDRVIAEFELTHRLTFPVLAGPTGPQKGYPTAFPRELFGEIRALTGDDTAMAAVREHWQEAVKIPLDDGATQADIDTAEDLSLLLRSVQSPQIR